MDVQAKVYCLEIMPKVWAICSAHNGHTWRMRRMLTELNFECRTNQLDELHYNTLFDPILKELGTMKRISSMKICECESHGELAK